MEHETVIASQSEQLLLKACHFGASDLHLIPKKGHYSILLRKFGRLVETGTLPDEMAVRIISYLKYLSSLDISEKRKPQSGAFQKEIEEHLYAFRISTLPSVFAKESMVVRVLRQHYAYPIASLCYDPQHAESLSQLVHQRQGLLLLSGATGSGKTTTLYSLIQYCRTALSRHVISLEDPVESSQEDLLQIQVNERAGVTYAAGLKAILRHSPDVIMIGEIRDRETAKIALEASLTGHLVLTTIHAKDTVNCLYRLLDLGISFDEMRQALVGIAAQTLIELEEQEERKAIFEILSDEPLSEAVCQAMNGNYYKMQTGTTLAGQIQHIKGSWR
ncbi:competence type IV pilus ATPase ComGA [Lysinibacillus odysseyi]|uniref:Competence protein ComG n=1 Tax=Lysinibacillus odysseyi 34hs-1 = NBRC 100172 TaxID=1220589 RepID=A0A0A3IA23_9BACI|nr:competence type IV pilus ATPase ComGA [Lysinibacillus odysseyi]KGR81584.1 competence protein ComG [Lysinibacillus odysseyi 34hs-1 = NBRC 100172]